MGVLVWDCAYGMLIFNNRCTAVSFS